MSKTPFRKISSFEPLFGANRRVVNPISPVTLDPRTILFSQLGGYYLKINSNQFLKASVLSPHVPISKGGLRIFDFLSTNLLYCNGKDPLWYQRGAEEYISLWFHSKDPGMIMCGPTGEMFRRLVHDRFGLPNPMVTLPGVYRENKAFKTLTHNIAEIYLPDIGKFVLFDVNSTFVVRWLNAIDLAKFCRKEADKNKSLTHNLWNPEGLDIYTDFALTFKPKKDNIRNSSDTPIVFSPDLVSVTPFITDRYHLVPLFYGGVAYCRIPGYATDFLSPDYYYGCLHTDPKLKKAAVNWIESSRLKIKVFPIQDIEAMLEAGFNGEIEAKPWLERVPESVIIAGKKVKNNDISGEQLRDAEDTQRLLNRKDETNGE